MCVCVCVCLYMYVRREMKKLSNSIKTSKLLFTSW